MILHNCIKCDYFEMIPLTNGQLPQIQRYECPKCKEIQWIKHSRLTPETYWNSDVIVDEINKTIKLKGEGL